MNINEAQSLSLKIQESAKKVNAHFPIYEVSDFLPLETFEIVKSNFPNKEDHLWETSKIGEVESKRRTTWSSIFDVPVELRNVVLYMNSSLFLKELSNYLKIPKLLSDPYFSGGGLNESFNGDYLDIHVDGNYHDASGLHRRANAILYLSDTWDSSWGGNFQVYSETGENFVSEVVPTPNKLVFFETSDISYHGFPEPINCPNEKSRRSLILYYYTKDSHNSSKIKESKPHSALWKKHGFTDKNYKKTRSYT